MGTQSNDASQGKSRAGLTLSQLVRDGMSHLINNATFLKICI